MHLLFMKPRETSSDMMLRGLHIDIEGGFGGSSRSLYELVSRFDRERLFPMVAHRSCGPITQRYNAIGLESRHLPEIVSFAPREFNSGKIFIVNIPRFLKIPKVIYKIKKIIAEQKIDYIHLNYEGLHVLGPSLRRQADIPIICHCRTIIPRNTWGRWVVKRIQSNCDYIFFISPNEEARFRDLESGRMMPGEVIWNIAKASSHTFEKSNVPYAIYLGNIDYLKGPDRLIEIAKELELTAAPPFKIKVFGEARANPKFLNYIVEQAKALSLGNRLEFCGHTSEPERHLVSALALIRPSRTNDPWGRDVIEATINGVPVLASGTYDGVVKPDHTGFLYDCFDPKQVTRDLMSLLVDPSRHAKLSENAKNEGWKFDGSHQVERFQTVVENLCNSVQRT